jgi:hypothetical protein
MISLILGFILLFVLIILCTYLAFKKDGFEFIIAMGILLSVSIIWNGMDKLREIEGYSSEKYSLKTEIIVKEKYTLQDTMYISEIELDTIYYLIPKKYNK